MPHIPTPTNVRIMYADGSVVPLECVYTGQDTDGVHVWAATLPMRQEEGARLLVDELPGMCSVVVAIN